MAAKKPKGVKKNSKAKVRKGYIKPRPRRGISKTEDYGVLPEFVILLSDEEFENLEVTPKNIDSVIKSRMYKKAIEQFKYNSIKYPRNLSADDVTLCDCNKRIGILSNPNLADFQGDPIVNQEGRPQGDPIVNQEGRPQGDLGDVNSFINLSKSVSASGLISVSSCCCKEPENEKQTEGVQVGVLDTGVDIKYVYEYMKVYFPEVNRNLYSVINKSCGKHKKSSNTSHGTMVVICLLEKYFGISSRKKRKAICINVFNVARDVVIGKDSKPTQIIAQSDVACALLTAAEENDYLNMSFGFSYRVHLIERVIIEILPLIKFITCSAGNNIVNLSSDLYANYPSQLAREIDTKKIKEVRGFMIEKNEKKLWVMKNKIIGSNKVLSTTGLTNYSLEWENAVLHPINLSGGTSFSSPRLLGELILKNA